MIDLNLNTKVIIMNMDNIPNKDNDCQIAFKNDEKENIRFTS